MVPYEIYPSCSAYQHPGATPRPSSQCRRALRNDGAPNPDRARPSHGHCRACQRCVHRSARSCARHPKRPRQDSVRTALPVEDRRGGWGRSAEARHPPIKEVTATLTSGPRVERTGSKSAAGRSPSPDATGGTCGRLRTMTAGTFATLGAPAAHLAHLDHDAAVSHGRRSPRLQRHFPG
jgi:hypothetical protein